MLNYGVMLKASQLTIFSAFMIELSVIDLSESTKQSARELRRLFLLGIKELVSLAPKRVSSSARSEKMQPNTPKRNAA